MEGWIEEYFSWSDEALRAIEAEGNWEYVPEEEYGGIPIYSYDDSRWYRYEVFFGSEIEHGIPYITEWVRFECGDFNFHERHKLTSNGERKLAKTLFKESDNSWLRYIVWVRDTSKDPLRELGGIIRERHVKQKWQYRIARSIVGVILKDVRKDGRGAWKHPEELPEYVKEFFLLKKIGGRWVVFGELPREDRPTFNETFTNGQRLFSRDGNTHFKDVCEIDVVTAVSKKSLRKQIKNRAENLLKKKGGDIMIITMQQCVSLSEDTARVGGYFQRGLGSECRWPTCTCLAYKFSKRTINFGDRMVAPHCKHILQAQEERCGWHQQWGDESQEKRGICPRCGGPTEYVDVYV